MSSGKACDFRGSSLDAWLFLLTRSENSEIEISSSTTADDPATAAGIQRLANLSEGEKQALAAEQQQELIDLGCKQAEIDDSFYVGRKEGEKKGLEEGRKEGLEEGKKEGLEEGEKKGKKESQIAIAKNLMCTLPGIEDAKISELTNLTFDEIQTIRKG